MKNSSHRDEYPAMQSNGPLPQVKPKSSLEPRISPSWEYLHIGSFVTKFSKSLLPLPHHHFHPPPVPLFCPLLLCPLLPSPALSSPSVLFCSPLLCSNPTPPLPLCSPPSLTCFFFALLYYADNLTLQS